MVQVTSGESPVSEGKSERSNPGITTRPSPRPVSDTVDRLIATVAAMGLTLFDVIDHSGGAAAVGLALRETRLVIFGNPVGGTPVMVASPLAALDLPLRVVVWDDEGQTRVSYTSPEALAIRYGLGADLVRNLRVVDAVTDAVVEP